jgi:hypothetical protein
MQSDANNSHVLFGNNRPIALVAVVLSNFLLTSCVGSGSDLSGTISVHRDSSGADGNTVAEDVMGPTLLLSYRQEDRAINPISSFMYFVPLISPTRVDRVTSADNEQHVGIISYHRKASSTSFNVVCEFEIVGKGFHKNTFDFAGMVMEQTDKSKKGKPLTNMLDYIQFEGEGFGRIEVKGTMAGSTPTVTEMNMQFNAKGRKSPVTIGLYDVQPKDGQYLYENKSNPIVARVNSLIFKKSKTTPRMGIKVASISKSSDSDGFWGSIKGGIANLLISPPRVDPLGNETMLDFGYAMLTQKTEFTFPKAKNIKESKIAAIDPANK